MAWLLVSFLLGVSYSGVLRASLISPEYTKAMETIEDIVNSGLPWKIVLFGSSHESLLSDNPDEPYATFWKRKEVVPYSDFPHDIVRQQHYIFIALV